MKRHQAMRSELRTSHGREVFILVDGPEGRSFSDSVLAVMERYESERNRCGLGSGAEVSLKFHLSDIANQERALQSYLTERATDCLYSVCGQPPSSGAKLALQAYLAQPTNGGHFAREQHHQGRTLRVNHGAYESWWMSFKAPEKNSSSFEQSTMIFRDLKTRLAEQRATLSDHLVRTWIYVRDIDRNYRGLVDARARVFQEEGLTAQTHYVASTGIGAESREPQSLLQMDALSVKGLELDQILFLKAPEHLCPTSDYGVTFERGTALTFGDRSHAYISGTASIDPQGRVLFRGSPVKQSEQILVNIEALLGRGGMRLSDLKYLLVYLRDPADESVVRDFLQRSLPAEIPWLMVRGAVCRPEWLVEIEGLAGTPSGNQAYSPYF